MTIEPTVIIPRELAFELLDACIDAEQLWRERRVRTSGYDYSECDDYTDRYDDAAGKLGRLMQGLAIKP